MYDPAFCERVVECASAGGTLDSFAAAMGVARSTLTRWAQEHEDFRTAIERAKTALAARLHGECMESGSSPFIGYRVKLLANLAPEDFRDRSEVGVGGTLGAPPVAVAQLSDTDALARYLAMSQRAAT